MARKKVGNKRQDLIEAAKQLFLSEGIAKVSVSRIVRAAGVAQGTFYLYFDSKDSVIDAIGQEMSWEAFEGIAEIVDQPDLNALEKLLAIKELLFNFLRLPNQEVFSHFHGAEHREAHDRIADAVLRQLAPVFQRIIEQGIGENIFNLHYPEQASKLIVSMMNVPHAELLKDKASIPNWGAAITELILQALGVKREIIDKYIEL